MFFYTFMPKLFNMSLTASVAIVLVILLRLLLKKAPKVISYALWGVVLFRLLCPVSIESGFSFYNLFDTSIEEAGAITSVIEYVPSNIVHAEDPAVTLPVPGISDAINEALPQGQEQLVADPLEAPMSFVTYLWMAGVLVMAIYSVVSYLRLHRKLSVIVPLQENIFIADDIGSPFVIGLIRPKIYLPCNLSEKEQEYIILHEQHHIRRYDHITKALAFFALTIHWFNPLVWVAFLLAGKDMEMSCDEAVIRKVGSDVRADYSASLLTLATGRRIIAGTPLAFGEGDTKGRIRNLPNWKKPAVWVILIAVIACIVLAVCLLTNPRSFRFDETSQSIVSASFYDVRTSSEGSTELNSAQISELSSRLYGVKNTKRDDKYAGLTPAYQISALLQDDTYIRINGYSLSEEDKVDIEWNGMRYVVSDVEFQAYLSRICMGGDTENATNVSPVELMPVELMGLDCWYTEEETIPNFIERTYYAAVVDSDMSFRLAESFGLEIDDHIVDLDGDGITELVSNCQWGDGAKRVYIYRMNGDTIERGWLNWDASELRDFKDWGINATRESYDPETGFFMLDYDTNKGAFASRAYHYLNFKFEEYVQIPKTEPLPTPITVENLFASMPGTFHFLSGAGGWQTELYWHGDGTFSGIYEDANAEAQTLYRCVFTGRMSTPEKIDALEYSARIAELNYEKTDVTTFEHGFSVITTTPYGLDDADEIRIYLPGYPVSKLSTDVMNCLRGGAEEFWEQIPETLPFFVLYNVRGKQAFFSADWSTFVDRSHTELTFMVEGEEESLPATRYSDVEYALYIPDDGWQHQRGMESGMLIQRWTAEHNPAVSLTVRHLGYRDLADAQDWERTYSSEFPLIEDKQGGLLGEYNGILLDIRFFAGQNAMYAVELRYPVEAVEGFGTRLQVMRDTFQCQASESVQ